jgi:hypothetical protein
VAFTMIRGSAELTLPPRRPNAASTNHADATLWMRKRLGRAGNAPLVKSGDPMVAAEVGMFRDARLARNVLRGTFSYRQGADR